jgi:hypothetical protein
MRFRHVLLMLLVAALAVTAGAAAGDRPGKPEKNRPDRSAPCRHKNVLLHGTFMAAGADSFTMNVLKGNRGGRKLKGEQTLAVDDKTRFRRKGKEGKAALADLLKDDRLLVLARCNRGETAGSFSLLARFVKARPPKPATPDSD